MKERYEWLHSWCDEAPADNLPRVLLVGDSITEQYQEYVRKALIGRCYVDFLATSYPLDSAAYFSILKAFVSDSKYALIHFNNGLHGFHLSSRIYRVKYKKFVSIFEGSKVILANTTFVYCAGNLKPDRAKNTIVEERNKIVGEIANECGFAVNDLYSLSRTIANMGRNPDGTHFAGLGIDILGKKVVESVLNELLKK